MSSDRKIGLEIEGSVEKLCSEDQAEFDAGYHEILENIENVSEQVFRAVSLVEDPKVRGALIELLGESRDAQYIPFLAEELNSDSQEIRFWAFAALQRIATAEAMRLVKDFDKK